MDRCKPSDKPNWLKYSREFHNRVMNTAIWEMLRLCVNSHNLIRHERHTQRMISYLRSCIPGLHSTELFLFQFKFLVILYNQTEMIDTRLIKPVNWESQSGVLYGYGGRSANERVLISSGHAYVMRTLRMDPMHGVTRATKCRLSSPFMDRENWISRPLH